MMPANSSCHRALATLAAVACVRLRSGELRGDYCSGGGPTAAGYACIISGNTAKWPTHALLGSQLTRRLDVMKQAVAHGCDYAHVPLQGPAAWAESTFDLGRSCARSPRTFDYGWRRFERTGKFLRSVRDRGGAGGAGGQRSSTMPRGDLASATALVGLRSRLQPARTEWFEDSSPADAVQFVAHIRRGDLNRHRLESDQGRWVPDEYYEEILPRLVRALVGGSGGGGAPVHVHICSEYAPGWRGLSRRWEALLLSAGAQRVRFHLGSPWPASWNSSEATNREIVESLHHMSDADVLLTSRSGFSKAAAHYSLGLVLSVSGSQPGVCTASSTTSSATSSATTITYVSSSAQTPPRAETACLSHGLPPPPKCTASTDDRLAMILHDPRHVDYQCCFGRWRNATPKSRHCIGGCLAIGDDIRARPPGPTRRRHAFGEHPDSAMPIWSPAHGSWVWCPAARSRVELLRQLRAAAGRNKWEAAVAGAAAALVAQKRALRGLQGGRERGREWSSLWHLLSSLSAAPTSPSSWSSSAAHSGKRRQRKADLEQVMENQAGAEYLRQLGSCCGP